MITKIDFKLATERMSSFKDDPAIVKHLRSRSFDNVVVLVSVDLVNKGRRSEWADFRDKLEEDSDILVNYQGPGWGDVELRMYKGLIPFAFLHMTGIHYIAVSKDKMGELLDSVTN